MAPMPNDLPQLPSLDAHGLLPPGVYDCSLEDVERLFGQFQRSDRRLRLFAHLRDYIDQLQKAGIKAQVIIDGSFVMGCVDEPDDIDLVLVLPADWDFSVDLPPYRYNLIAKHRVGRRYGFDLIVVAADSSAETQWTDFFQGIGPKWRHLPRSADDRKGVLRIIA